MIAHINIGSNLGNRAANLRRAVLLLGERLGLVRAQSTVIETPAWGYSSDQAFLNQGVNVETNLHPLEIVRCLKAIEQEMAPGGAHRAADGSYVDRIIDLDLICLDHMVCHSPEATVPHPRMMLREFVLRPLNEILPNWNMKSFEEVIAVRRSVRAYDASRKVEQSQIKEMIRAAQEAPSWKNQQTSRYHVALSHQRFEAVRQCLSERNRAKVAGASALVVTTFVRNIVGFNREGQPDNELGNGWGIYDLGLSNSIFLLKAAELGVDSLVMGLRDAEALRQTLNIADDETVVAVIALGHRSEEPERPPRKPLADIAKFY